jgi:hypothetical protein
MRKMPAILPLVFMMTLIVIPVAVPADQPDTLNVKIKNIPFTPGEKLYFRMNYSIFTVGRAEILVNPIKYYIEDKTYYKIDIYGRTAGAGAIVSTVNDNWGALLDTDNLLPLKAWRNIEEGRFRKKEYVNYDHQEGIVNVRVVNNETGRLKEPEIYEFEDPYTLDLISGYMYLRTINFVGLNLNDTLVMKGFFEDQFYDFKILYKGIETIDTKLGEIDAFKLVPVMPDNKIFAGENSITAWFAADESRIPLKVVADMFIGRAGCEITGFEGMKKKPEFQDD